MFCPKCSQEQISDEMRFCSRCGFDLSGVSELLLNDGAMLENSEEKSGLTAYLRQKSALPGAKIMFFSVCLLPVAVGIGIIVNCPAPLLAAVIPFFIGLVYMLYALAFGNRSSKARHKTAPKILPISKPFYVAPLSAAETDQLTPIPPSSVTDQTTKLLEIEIKNKPARGLFSDE